MLLRRSLSCFTQYVLRFCLSSLLIDIVYSQPADTGTGTDINTQIVYAVNHLKVNDDSEYFV